jgi:DNA-binding CsgD family transcriptional regulator
MAGNSYLNNRDIGKLTATENRSGFRTYRAVSGESYTGLQSAFKLYPSGSPYADEEWTLALLMPEGDWGDAVSEGNAALYVIGVAFLAVSLLAAVFLSKRYIRPVLQALEAIKTDASAMPITQIAEIDDLFEFLSRQDAAPLDTSAPKTGSETAPVKNPPALTANTIPVQPNLSPYLAFVERIGTLTKAEGAVFDLYAQGFKAGEIAEKLYVSLSTIRFHNRNIYAKLGVGSGKEMMVYIRMRSEASGSDEKEGDNGE